MGLMAFAARGQDEFLASSPKEDAMPISKELLKVVAERGAQDILVRGLDKYFESFGEEDWASISEEILAAAAAEQPDQPSHDVAAIGSEQSRRLFLDWWSCGDVCKKCEHYQRLAVKRNRPYDYVYKQAKCFRCYHSNNKCYNF